MEGIGFGKCGSGEGAEEGEGWRGDGTVSGRHGCTSQCFPFPELRVLGRE